MQEINQTVESINCHLGISTSLFSFLSSPKGPAWIISSYYSAYHHGEANWIYCVRCGAAAVGPSGPGRPVMLHCGVSAVERKSSKPANIIQLTNVSPSHHTAVTTTWFISPLITLGRRYSGKNGLEQEKHCRFWAYLRTYCVAVKRWGQLKNIIHQKNSESCWNFPRKHNLLYTLRSIYTQSRHYDQQGLC